MEVTLGQLVLGIVLGSVVMVAVFMVGSRMLHGRAERALRKARVVCRLCGHVYLSGEDGEVSACGACGALNSRKANGKLG